MFSKFELAVIEVDVSHVLKLVSLDDQQRKTRENIVKKITSHNKQSGEIECTNCGILLPPMEPGEGDPSKSGYLCRTCFGLD